jgi:hypothetical protein
MYAVCQNAKITRHARIRNQLTKRSLGRLIRLALRHGNNQRTRPEKILRKIH